jgi:hypothetical protein
MCCMHPVLAGGENVTGAITTNALSRYSCAFYLRDSGVDANFAKARYDNLTPILTSS